MHAVDGNLLCHQIRMRFIRDVSLRHLLEREPRLWSPQRKTGPFLGDVADSNFTIRLVNVHFQPGHVIGDKARARDNPEALLA